MANAFGRGLIKIKDIGTYEPLKKLYVKNGPAWQDAKTAWVKQNGEWIQVYPTPKAEIVFDPPTLNFTAPNGYESAVQYVNITNTGTENLIIEDFTTSYTVAGKFVTFFDLTEIGGQIPTTIAPGETKRLGIAIDAGSGASFIQQETVTVSETTTSKTVNVLNPLKEVTVDYLVVAGGGGSGVTMYGWASNYRHANGGGAGGVISGAKRIIKRGETIPIKVGQGGAAATGGYNSNGSPGGNSSFGSAVAIGGGGGFGGSNDYAGNGSSGQGGPGGSGGGGSIGGLGTTGQGNPGSKSAGGGAGGGGFYVDTVTGFPGIASKITGTKTFYGGGGAGYGGKGGIGGGGDSGKSGAPNTGGGGGGPGGAGGSGVIIVKYDYDKQLGEGGTVTSYTSDDGVTHWVHTYTKDGTFTYREVIDTITVPVVEKTSKVTSQLVMTNAGELGSSDSTIRIKTNIGAFGTKYVNYTIFGEVTAPFATAIVDTPSFTISYARYAIQQTRQNIIITNTGNGSLIIPSITSLSDKFNILDYPTAIAPGQSGVLVIETRIDDIVPPGTYTSDITIYSNSTTGLVHIAATLIVKFPAGSVTYNLPGEQVFTVPDDVWRLSELRVVGGGGGGGTGARITGTNAGGGGGGSAGAIMSTANVEVRPGQVITFKVGDGGLGGEPPTDPAKDVPVGISGSSGFPTTIPYASLSASGGHGGGGSVGAQGGTGADGTPNPVITSPALVPRGYGRPWSDHMANYAVWIDYGVNNSFIAYRVFVPPLTGNYTFGFSCDNYGTLAINGVTVLGTSDFSSGGIYGATRYTATLSAGAAYVMTFYGAGELLQVTH